MAGVIFHTVKGTQYTSPRAFVSACARLGIRQSMGRAGCALDNATAESCLPTLQHERLSRHRYPTRLLACRDVAAWIDQWHNRRRRRRSKPVPSIRKARSAPKAGCQN